MSYTNEDLAAVQPKDRNWNTWNYAALWISMSLCIPTYMLASSLIEGGMNWWQAILTIFLGNLIVLVPMVLNGHAGARYGIPFPVFARASFGTARREHAGAAARDRRLRLVRHPDLDRRLRALPDGARSGSAASRTFPRFFRRRWASRPARRSPSCSSGRSTCRSSTSASRASELLLFKAIFLPLAALALLAWAIWAGERPRPDPGAAFEVRRRPASSGRSSSRRSPAWSASGRRSR